MKKIISFMILLAMMAVLCSGCHDAVQRNAFVVPDEFDTSRQYEITFWAKNDTNNDQVAVYRQAVADFEKLYPNITVKIKWYTDYGRMYQDVITNIATNTTPNVCITYPDHIATYLTSENSVVNLDALMADEKYGLGGSALLFDGVTKEQIIPQFFKEGQFNSKQYALPFMRSTEACYINKTLVESLGYTIPDVLTWDFVWEVSEKAMSLGKKMGTDGKGNAVEVFAANGQTTLIPFIYKSTDNMMITMLRQKNAGYSTGAGHVEIFNDTTTDLLYEIASHAESGAFSTFAIDGYPANYLNAGQCIFAIDSTAGAAWMGCDAPHMDIPEESLQRFETVVRTVPQYNTEHPTMISQGPSVCVFNKSDSQEVLASWLFAQFLLTDDVQIGYAQTEGYVPVTSKAQESTAYQDYLSRAGEDNGLYYSVKLEATKLLLENTENTFVTPVFNGSASLRNAAGKLIEEVTKAGQRDGTVDEAFLTDLQAKMTTLYYLDEIETGGLRNDLGALPQTAVLLLAAIGAAWVGIAAISVINYKKNRKKA